MTLHHLEIFVTICLEGSITRAAERLHISQPTVSVALQQLESHYGTRLFDRLSHKLYITPFGEIIYEQARSLLDLWDDLIHADQPLNKVRIGTGTAVGKLLLPTVIKSFLQLHPNAQINVNVGDATKMCFLVMDNSLDFVIAETAANIPGLSQRAFQQYPVVAICHKNNPLSEKKIVTAEDLAHENLLLREKDSSTRQLVDMYFHNHNIHIEPMWESYSVQTLLNATRENIGISFLSLDHVLAYQSPNLIILNIPDFQEKRFVNLFFHKNKFFTPIMDEFIEHYTNSVKILLNTEVEHYKLKHPDSSYTFPVL